ncbi:hypothetical protein [Escherichia coli]|nr:hypothetical protein [Escherichia coli]MCW3372797.1 hypothetical protein [Escherichia coli]
MEEWLKSNESGNYNASRIWREMVAGKPLVDAWRITRDEEIMLPDLLV